MIHTTIRIQDLVTEDQITPAMASTTCETSTKYPMTLAASPDPVPLPFGSVDSAQYVYVGTDTAIRAYLNGNPDYVTVDSMLLLFPTAVSSISVVAATGAKLTVYLAGTQI